MTPVVGAREPVTIPKAIELNLARGASTVVSFDHRPYPLAELDRRSNRMAHYLSSRVRPGDRVGPVEGFGSQGALLAGLAHGQFQRSDKRDTLL